MYINLPIKTKEKCLATQRCLFAMGYKWTFQEANLWIPSEYTYDFGISMKDKRIRRGHFKISTPRITLPEDFIIPEQYWRDK